jgi:hypothetical protein
VPSLSRVSHNLDQRWAINASHWVLATLLGMMRCSQQILENSAFQDSLPQTKDFVSNLLEMPDSQEPSSSLLNQPLHNLTVPPPPDTLRNQMPESNPLTTNEITGYFTESLSFRDQDEFFHCMLSYRVNSEGPWESQAKSGNDLARQIWQSCHALSKLPNRDAAEASDNAGNSNHQLLHAIDRFGKWPQVFPTKTSPVRMFLDKMNLCPGVDWEGSGNRESGGFLGALSSSLMLVPLLSSTPVRFTIQPAGEKGRFKFSFPVNISIPKEGESLEIFCDSSVNTAVAAQPEKELSFTCTEFRSDDVDGISFILKTTSSGQVVEETYVSSALFWAPKCILPSDGSGPRGSVSEMLTIMQKSEKLTFRVVERPSSEVAVLKVDELSDHVFFKNETILLHFPCGTPQSDGTPRFETHPLSIESIKVQGSTSAGIHSVITVKCDEYSNLLGAKEPCFLGMTMQKSEKLTFRVVERPSSEVAVLKVDELSDHVFFKNETILLHFPCGTPQSDGTPRFETHPLSIESIKVQGSTSAGIQSVITVKCDEYSNLLGAKEPCFLGMTVPDEQLDRKDNVLMEFMLARALHLAFQSDTNPHPCKLVMPVFVDDISVFFGVLQRLSTEVSIKTAMAVQLSLEKILRRKLSAAEEKEWIRVSVKNAVQFMTKFQGLELSNREHLLKSKQAKAELVCDRIVSTVGISVEKYCLEQYKSNNPVAHELLDFIKKENIGHITPSLVKSDVTSLKIFSQLSSKSIKIIAQDSRNVSKKPLVREIADIEIAVQAAKLSPYILPVSQRLANFQDAEASFMTIAYSTFAMEQVLLKPFFGKGIVGVGSFFFLILCAYQFYQGELIFAVVNLPRAVTLSSILFCIYALKNIQVGRMAMWFSFISQGIACIFAVVVVDKFENGTIVWNQSNHCSKNYESSKISTCNQYLYSYNFWQAVWYFIMSAFILWRQELCWRWWNAGCSVQTALNLAFQIILGSQSIYDYLGVIVFPLLLIGTELLKFYGTLQAIRLTKESKIKLSKVWSEIMKGEQTTPDDGKCGSLTELVKFVVEACDRSQFVLDSSKDLGKWKSDHVAVEPPLIHQPTSDFDELYGRAVMFNDVFQQWIKSFFTRKGDASRFLYINCEETKSYRFDFSVPTDYAKTWLPFTGEVDPGPVKRPHRSIAKVSAPAAAVLENDTVNALQVYRSYRGDVTLLTDIVRCAVQFATPNDLLNFVQNWLFLFGEPKRPAKKTTMKDLLAKHFREFKEVVNDFFHADTPSSNISTKHPANAVHPLNSVEQPPTGDVAAPLPSSADARQARTPGAPSRSEQGVDCDCDDCINSQRQHKIFEILRIRNRLDPALRDVPGGYRDFAVKIKIGFFRLDLIALLMTSMRALTRLQGPADTGCQHRTASAPNRGPPRQVSCCRNTAAAGEAERRWGNAREIRGHAQQAGKLNSTRRS